MAPSGQVVPLAGHSRLPVIHAAAPFSSQVTPLATAPPLIKVPVKVDTVVDAAYQGCFVDDETYAELRRARRRRGKMNAEVSFSVPGQPLGWCLESEDSALF